MSAATTASSSIVDEERTAAARSAEIWKDGARTVSDQVDLWARWTPIDPAPTVERYFDLLQVGVDLGRRWVREVAVLITDAVRFSQDHAAFVWHDYRDRAAAIADRVVAAPAEVPRVTSEQAKRR